MKLIVIAVCIFLATGCQRTGSETPQSSATEPIILAAATPELTVRGLYEHNLGGAPYNVIWEDNGLYDWNNREEILRTLEIVKVDTMQDRAAVFIRWSVGPKVYRGGHMLREFGDVWVFTSDRQTYFSEYDDAWKQDSVSLFDKRLQDWIDESQERFEQRSR